MERGLLAVIVLGVVAALLFVAAIYVFVTPPPKAPAPPGPVVSAPEWAVHLESGLTYTSPVYGPTTPLSDAYGGLWVINAAREGIIQMNLTGMSLGLSENPFALGNESLRLDVATDFAESAGPLTAVYYIVPAKDAAVNGSTGPTKDNGALAFFAGSDVVAADPFNRTVFFRYHLPFVPTWTGEDPASAGDMLIAPVQRLYSVGIITYPVGPYRYVWASDGDHTVVFELTYVHAGYCPCAPPSGRVLLFANETLTAPPFVYYDQSGANAGGAFRTGPGVAIVLPLANDTLELLDTTPAVLGWVPLTLDGLPAAAAGPIGFVQSDFPYDLFVPVRSSASVGLVGLDLSTRSAAFATAVGNASWQPIGVPVSRTGAAVYAAWYGPDDNRTRFVGVDGTGTVIPEFSATVPGRARSVFFVNEVSRVFAQTAGGGIVTLNTTYASAANVTPFPFELSAPSLGTMVGYAGSPGGTRYGSVMTPYEVRGGWTDAANGTTVLCGLLLPVNLASATASPSAPAAPAWGWGLPLAAVAGAFGLPVGTRTDRGTRRRVSTYPRLNSFAARFGVRGDANGRAAHVGVRSS